MEANKNNSENKRSVASWNGIIYLYLCFHRSGLSHSILLCIAGIYIAHSSLVSSFWPWYRKHLLHQRCIEFELRFVTGERKAFEDSFCCYTNEEASKQTIYNLLSTTPQYQASSRVKTNNHNHDEEFELRDSDAFIVCISSCCCPPNVIFSL
jgi:hypothetical protein